MTVFNHSAQRQTVDYLCIQPEEIKNIYLNELLRIRDLLHNQKKKNPILYL
jgi:hypothetical protein